MICLVLNMSIMFCLEFKVESCELDTVERVNTKDWINDKNAGNYFILNVVTDVKSQLYLSGVDVRRKQRSITSTLVLKSDAWDKSKLYLKNTDVTKNDSDSTQAYYFMLTNNYNNPSITFCAKNYQPLIYKIPFRIDSYKTYKIILKSVGTDYPVLK